MSAAERRDATLAELAAPVRTRVEGLEKLQENVDELTKEFDAKLAALREEYDKKKAPLFKQRYEVHARDKAHERGRLQMRQMPDLAALL